MPGKFPKVFQKRKSSGDVLEEVNGGRPVSTFRVLERPQEPQPLTTAYAEKPALGLRRKTADLRPLSEGDDATSGRSGANPMHRGSGGTQKSNSSYGAYDSSSGRYSSTSTLPSSVDGHDEYSHAHPRTSKTNPTTPTAESAGASGFLRNAGRKFSFGARKSMQAAESLRHEIANQSAEPMPERPLYGGIHDLHLDANLPAVPSIGRARAPTETSYASESTITIGTRTTVDKLELQAPDDDGFGDLFAGIGEERRKSKPIDGATAANLGRPLTDNKSYAPYRPAITVPPLNIDTGNSAILSPDLNTTTSADGLIVASPDQEKGGLFEMGITSPRDAKSKQTQSPMSPTRQNRPRRQSRQGSKGLIPRRESEHFEDTDALLVSKSISPKASPKVELPPPSYRDSPDSMLRTTAKSYSAADTTANPWSDERPPPVPSHGKAPEIRLPPQSPEDDGVDRTLLEDAAFQALASSADRVQTRSTSPTRTKPSGKVMTPAQFEKYRREQAQRRSMGDTSDSDSSKNDSSDEEEEEEDEIERSRRLAKQRQRQEAQLSVYRQSMMKITGEQPMGPSNSLRPSMDRNSTRLSTRISSNSLRDRASATPEEEDEDEDVPLGILAAHGFPSKELNRPPNHVRSASGAGIQYSSETYPPPQPPQSVAAGPSASAPMGGGNLPAFARNLPKDPFFGSSLVNQSDRQSFALGGGSPGSIYGGSNHSSSNLPPPGGLIGVIASEERARAIRRGTQAKTHGFGSQDPGGAMPLPVQMQQAMAPPPQIQPMPMSMPMPMVGPEQQANIQMAQQMTQMMQMQMQWMQQMMAMQAGGGQAGTNMQQMQQMQQMMQQMQGMGGMSGTPGTNMPPGMPGMGGLQVPGQAANNTRSSTMINPPNFNAGVGFGNQGGRAMSMMGGRAPSMMMGNGMGGGPGAGYTPSIAPSERSTIGQPSRYRPVSVVPGAGSDRSRSNSLSAQSNLDGFGMGNRASTMSGRPSTSGGGLTGRNSNMINVRLVETRSNGRDDDEDEAGWEEMRKKKENKRGLWRLKKNGGQGKENVSPQPSIISTGNASNSSRGSRSPRKSAAPPLPPPHGGSSQHKEMGLEGVFIPDLDRL